MVLSYAHSQHFSHRQPVPRETEPENVRTDLLIGNAQNPPEAAVAWESRSTAIGDLVEATATLSLSFLISTMQLTVVAWHIPTQSCSSTEGRHNNFDKLSFCTH